MAKAQTQQAQNTANNTISTANQQIPGVVSTLGTQQGQAQQTQANSLSDSQGGIAKSGSIVDIAGPTYQNMASTGGFSPTDETTYLNRATQGVKGTYDVLGQQAKNREASTGGLGTGGDISQMARQGTQQQALATENAQADLKQQENSNKLAGAAGLNSLAQTTNATTGLSENLYNTSTNQLTTQGQQILQALGLQYGTDIEGAQILAELSKNPGKFQTGFGDLLGLVSAGSGAYKNIQSGLNGGS